MADKRTVKIDILGDAKSAQAAFAGAERSSGGFMSSLAKFAVVGAVGFAAAEKLGGALLGMAKGAADDEANVRKLQVALQNAGVAWDGHTGAINDAIAASQALGFTDDATRDSLGLLTEQTGSADEAVRRLAIAQNLARGTGMDLETASKLVGKVSAENTEVLKKYGITIGEGATEQEALNIIDEKFKGQAGAYALTSAGKMAILADRISELKESIGQKLLPILLTLSSFLLDKVMPAAERFTNWLSGPTQRAFESVVNFIRGPTMTAFEAIKGVVDTLTTAFDEGGLSGVLSKIPGILGNIASAVTTAFTEFDWSGTASTVGGAILDGIVAGWNAVTGFGGRFVDWFVTQVTAIDYKGTGAAILDGIVAGWHAVTGFGERFIDWIVGVFQGIEWTALGQAILDGIITGFKAVTGWGQTAVDTIVTFFESVEWTALGQAILDGIITGWKTVEGWGQTAVDTIVTLFESVEWTALGQLILDKILEAFKSVKGWGQAVVDWIKEQVAGADWSGVKKTIKDHLNEALGGDEDTESPILKMLQPVIDLMAGEWAQILGNFTGIWANLKGILLDLTGITLPNGALATGLKVVAGAITGLITVLALQQILDFTSHIKEASDAVMFLTGVALILVDFMTGDWSARWDQVKSKLSTVWDATSGIPGIVKTGIVGAKDAIAGVLYGGYDTIQGKWDTTWDAIKGKVSDIAGGMYDIGYSIVTGVADGIRAGFGSVESAVSDLVALIPGPVKKLLGISSPSKVMIPVGWSVAEGVAKGLREGTDLYIVPALAYMGATIANYQIPGGPVTPGGFPVLGGGSPIINPPVIDDSTYWPGKSGTPVPTPPEQSTPGIGPYNPQPKPPGPPIGSTFPGQGGPQIVPDGHQPIPPASPGSLLPGYSPTGGEYPPSAYVGGQCPAGTSLGADGLCHEPEYGGGTGNIGGPNGLPGMSVQIARAGGPAGGKGGPHHMDHPDTDASGRTKDNPWYGSDPNAENIVYNQLLLLGYSGLEAAALVSQGPTAAHAALNNPHGAGAPRLAGDLYSQGGNLSSFMAGQYTQGGQSLRFTDPAAYAARVGGVLLKSGLIGYANVGGGSAGDVFIDGHRAGVHIGAANMRGKFHRKKLSPNPC